MDRSFLDTHEASDSESWLLNDGLDARQAFLKNNQARLLGGGTSKACCAKTCLCFGILLFLVILGYGIFLIIVFGGVPQLHLISLTPQCKDTAQCLSAGSTIPFRAVFNARNPNRMDVRINADIQLFKTDGVTRIGEGKIRWAPLDLYHEEERGRNKGLLNQLEATVYVRSSSLSREWLEFFFREGTKVFSKPRLSTTILPLPANIQQLTQPNTFNMVLLTTVTLHDVCFWLPEMTSDEFIMVGDPTRAPLLSSGGTQNGNMQPPSLSDPNFANNSPLPPSNVDASLPWAATGVTAPADAGLPLPSTYTQAGGFVGSFGFNLREKQADKNSTSSSPSPPPQNSPINTGASNLGDAKPLNSNKQFGQDVSQNQQGDQGQLSPGT